MAEHYDFGKLAEKKAAEYLLQKGYVVKATNWFYQKAELDIVALKGNILAIVEVKARSSDVVLNPEDAVNAKKIKLLIMAADAYVQKYNLDVEVRFDIVSMLHQNEKWKITHIEDAFGAY